MTTLPVFLLARLDEDEAVVELLRRPGGDPWGWQPKGYSTRNPQILTVNPARVVADIEAKRRIVEEHRGGKWPHAADPCDAHDANGETIPCETLRLLALPYADHPEYREEWKP